MKRIKLPALAVSVVLHGLLFLLFLRTGADRTMIDVRRSTIDLVVGVNSPTSASPLPSERSNRKVRSRANKIGGSQTSLRLKDFSLNSSDIRMGRGKRQESDAGAPSESNVEAWAEFDDPQSYSLSGDSYDQGNAYRGFLEAIHARINGRLIFDSILAQYGHFGRVFIEFEVDHRGVISTETLRTSTNDKILKVHVIRSALLPGLAQPLKESFWLKQQPQIRVRARFEFLKGSVEANLYDQNPERVSGLALSFRRFTPEMKVARTLGKQLLNGGLSYDLFAMYESWEKYNKARERERLDIDPFAIHRADEYYNR